MVKSLKKLRKFMTKYFFKISRQGLSLNDGVTDKSVEGMLI